MDYVRIAIGFLLLFGGGEFLVRGAVGLARRLGVSPLLVGATVVAFGTSAPELAVSVRAVLTGHEDIALGSVVGSNIANVLLILGVSSAISPVAWSRRAVLRDATGLAFASLIFSAIAATAGVSRLEGGFMLALLLGLTCVNFVRDRRRRAYTFELLERGADEVAPASDPLPKALLLTAVGLVGIVIGADQLVAGASAAARTMGISEATIGLTLVAIGTSLPELAACMVAAYHKHSDLALGNVIGSNVFNMLGITGTAALLAPLPIPGEILHFDLWLMLAIMLLTGAILAFVGRLGRVHGALFLACYAIWILGKA